jgi:hypothetical protein
MEMSELIQITEVPEEYNPANLPCAGAFLAVLAIKPGWQYGDPIRFECGARVAVNNHSSWITFTFRNCNLEMCPVTMGVNIGAGGNTFEGTTRYLIEGGTVEEGTTIRDLFASQG